MLGKILKKSSKNASNKELAFLGVFWNSVQLIVNQSFSFVIRLVLARLLFPEQFGIVGMATVFIGFVQVFNDLGIGAALVQRKEEELREAHYHTAFWTGLGWSVGIYLIMSLAVAPLAAMFYQEPILQQIIPIMSIGIIASPFKLVQRARLVKQMDFKKIAMITNSATIFSGVLSLALALLGAGVWSLVFNSVAAFVVAIPLFIKATKWVPKLIWDKAAFHDVFGFGVYMTGTNFVNYLFNNIDYLLIGKLLSAQALGVYTFAFVLTDTFRGKLMKVLNEVMYPLYGKKQSDPQTLKRYYLKVVTYNSIVIYPIMVFMFTLGEPFILQFFGDKWIGSVEPLKILSLSVMVHMMANSNTALIRGMGRPDLEMKLQIFKAAIFVPSLALGIYYFGIIGASWAVVINKVIAVIIAQYTFNYLLRIKVSTLEFMASLKGPWVASVVSFLFAYVFYNLLGIHYIITGIALFAVYALVIWLIMKSEIQVLVGDIKRKKRK